MRLALFTVITSRRDLWRSNSHRVWLILWLLGVVASYTPYGFIHLLLLIAAHGALRFFDFCGDDRSIGSPDCAAFRAIASQCTVAADWTWREP